MTNQEEINIRKIFDFILANEMGFDYFERFFILVNSRPPNDEEKVFFNTLVAEYDNDMNEESEDDSYSYEESYDEDEDS